jgi:hypothetical protein
LSDFSTTSVEALLVLDAVELQARGDVVLDRHRRERVGPLEDHADGAAHVDRVHCPRVEVLVVEENLAVHPSAGDHLMHPVERP